MTRRSFVVLPVGAAFAARWDEPPFPDWNPKFIDRLLTDSPWSRPWKGTAVQDLSDKPLISSRWSQLGMELPPLPRGGRSPRTPRIPAGSPRPEDNRPVMLRLAVDLTIRWASALPIRRAYALQEFGQGGLANDKARALLGEEPRGTILELAGIPHALATRELEQNLAKARLSVPGRRTLTPASVEVPTMGVQVTARLLFPRIAALSPEAGEIGFFAESGSLKIDEKFKVRSMVYEGRVEL
jgi:hypothetical protein